MASRGVQNITREKEKSHNKREEEVWEASSSARRRVRGGRVESEERGR